MRALNLIVLSLFLSGCSAHRTNLTPGAAKRHIQPGLTTQAEVIEVFGSPNILTKGGGGEVWVYDKVSSRQTDSAFGIAGLGAGGGDSAVGALGSGAGRRSRTRSETTVMLIIYFDDKDVVTDYKITQAKF